MGDAGSRSESRQRAPLEGAEILVSIGGIQQLFNSMDPSPFRERDLDPKAEQFIIDCARSLPRHRPLRLELRLTRPGDTAEDLSLVKPAVHDYFAWRAAETRTRLRRLLRIGGWSLLIGVAFVAFASLVGDWMHEIPGNMLHESFMVGAWVAMWRPLEILLYDWWPVLADVRLFDRLSIMGVEVRHVQGL